MGSIPEDTHAKYITNETELEAQHIEHRNNGRRFTNEILMHLYVWKL